jgi:hypothetical protein
MLLHHTTHHADWTPHVGACLSTAPLCYGRGRGDAHGTVAVELDLAGLDVEHVDMTSPEWRALRDEQVYPGDSDDPHVYGADVLVYADEDESGKQHLTYRLMTERAVEACRR